MWTGEIEPTGTLGGSALASWTPVTVLLAAYVVVVGLLWWAGRGRLRDLLPVAFLQTVGRGIHRVTGVPGWAGVAVGQALYGLLLAGQGFYSDVAWHVAYGRDDELFTAPHTAILLGLVGILAAGVFGVVVATVDRVDTGATVAGFRVPWSLVPLLALGVGAVSGFPADEVWHEAFGVDVTMWSPTHMLMILGASFVGLAGWLVLAESGVRPGHGRWPTFLHGLAAWLTLQGLVASQGEYSFGVPQFALVFHPILVAMASGLGLVLIRLVFGRGWALGMAAITLATQLVQTGDSGPVETRQGATFVLSAVVVEVVAHLAGTERRDRFAIWSGLGIGTIGLAGETVWNQAAHQPWGSSLLPAAVVWSTIGAVGSALLGAAAARAFPWADAGRRIAPHMVAVAVTLTVVPVFANLDRHVGDVTAAVSFDDSLGGGAEAFVTVVVDPPGAADDAHWFQATAWQGGGLVLADMEPTGRPGEYRSDRPVPTDGLWKTLLRLHRDDELMAVPLWFPADPEIDEPEIPAVDRTMAFQPETDYLLRETFDGDSSWLSPIVHGYLVLVLCAWFGAFVVAVRGLEHRSAAADAAPVPTGA